jgi:hypothetical protein
MGSFRKVFLAITFVGMMIAAVWWQRDAPSPQKRDSSSQLYKSPEQQEPPDLPPAPLASDVFPPLTPNNSSTEDDESIVGSIRAKSISDRSRLCYEIPSEESADCFAEKLAEELDIGFEPPMKRWNRNAAWDLVTNERLGEWEHMIVLALYVDWLNECTTNCDFDFLNDVEAYYDSTNQNFGEITKTLKHAREVIKTKSQ